MTDYLILVREPSDHDPRGKITCKMSIHTQIATEGDDDYGVRQEAIRIRDILCRPTMVVKCAEPPEYVDGPV